MRAAGLAKNFRRALGSYSYQLYALPPALSMKKVKRACMYIYLYIALVG
jgi:hypothetical protein